MHFLDQLKDNLRTQCDITEISDTRSATKNKKDYKLADIVKIALEINIGRKSEQVNYVSPIYRIKADEFVAWCHLQAGVMKAVAMR